MTFAAGGVQMTWDWTLVRDEEAAEVTRWSLPDQHL